MPSTLDQTFSALSDPTRRAILGRLAAGESNVTDLAAPFLNHMTLPAITKHLKVLENANLITRSKDAQFRPCKLNPAGLKDVSDWLDDYRRMWEESFDRLDAYLKTITQSPPPTKKKGKKHGQPR